MTESLVYNKSKAFAIRVVKLYKWLIEEKREFVISKQCLRCGTSIGANLAEALCGLSRPDFTFKLHISLKEANETLYWLELLKETDYITTEMYDSLNKDCLELVKMLTSIIVTTKQNDKMQSDKTMM